MSGETTTNPPLPVVDLLQGLGDAAAVKEGEPRRAKDGGARDDQREPGDPGHAVYQSAELAQGAVALGRQGSHVLYQLGFLRCQVEQAVEHLDHAAAPISAPPIRSSARART